MNRKVRVLIVDDSAMVRKILSDGLSTDQGIEVIGTAADVFIARDKIVKFKPDVLTLDVEMPKMDGVEFLRRLMPQFPVPVVMVSSLTVKGKKITMDALEAGAVDFVSKPTTDVARGLEGMLSELRTKVKIASCSNVSHWKNKRVSRAKTTVSGGALSESTDKVIVIGASTGGTEAIREVIERFPRNTPGVVIVQHMPGGFTKVFSERMNSLCQMEVKEAENDDRVLQGRVLIAPGGDRQMRIVRSGGVYRIKLESGEKVCGHRPSVEVLMQSAAKSVGGNAVGVMLTGMGHDGADGMVAMRKSGARTMAQDEASCVVYGMPKEAYDRGGAEVLVPLGNIASKVISLLSGKRSANTAANISKQRVLS